MQRDDLNKFRPLLEADPPEFVDRVDSPWDQVPDYSSYNETAYKRIVRDLERLKRESERGQQSDVPAGASSRGILILGEAGTGKTHLLMRVAKNLSDTNHILFVRKPNNEEAVAQHIWANIVNSLSRNLPTSRHNRSQLDDLLAHVFSRVLLPGFESEIARGVNVEQFQRWVNQLREDPYNLFSMVGEGERRMNNLNAIRNRTLRYLQVNHPEVDQRIARALITYCFVATADRKRLLLTWLSGQDLEETTATNLGLPTRWVEIGDTSTDVSVQQQAEEQALRAIRTIGILSTYYQPLILAFDQLEGLRGEEHLTKRWGDVVREIFTMTPNFLVVTCIFPSLWHSWFQPQLDESAAQRISQQTIELERFGPTHALALLQTHLASAFVRLGLPTNIYPFTEDAVASLCHQATSPRAFIQRARAAFEVWLDDNEELERQRILTTEPQVITQQAITQLTLNTLKKYHDEQLSSYGTALPIEEDAFGRLKTLVKTLMAQAGTPVTYKSATCGNYVMPKNFIVQGEQTEDKLCFAVAFGTGNAFAARARNLLATLQAGKQFKHAILLRDSRCGKLGAQSKAYIQAIEQAGGTVLIANSDEIVLLQALYDTLVAVEEHDLSIGAYEIDKPQFVQIIRSQGTLELLQLFRQAGRLSPLFAQLTQPSSETDNVAKSEEPPPADKTADLAPSTPIQSPVIGVAHPNQPFVKVDVLIGDTELKSTHYGVLGELREDQRRLAISLTKPQCLVVLGYMGSGKSYSLGVLVENALLASSALIHQTRPMTVVAFNYRRNPESRFEYGGFRQPNAQPEQVARLRERYNADPQAVAKLHVFGYEQELRRRQTEYNEILTYPIQFRPDELGAEHWEILMKPPSPATEYMDIVRDIIQKLYYQERLTFKNLERHIQTDERLTDSQRKRAMNRLSFAQRWIVDERSYEWSDVLQAGTLNIFDLRMQTMSESEALKLCLIVTDLVRRTRNGVNKMIVFDEAHEYVDCKELIGELENAITQIRHDGLSFVLASQFPERIPERIFKYLLTRLIFKLPTAAAINYLRRAAPNLNALSPQQVSNLDLEQGVCFIQTDDDCTDPVLRKPQLLEVRPRLTQHSGATVRNVEAATAPLMTDSALPNEEKSDDDKTLAELEEELGVKWERLLKLLGLPAQLDYPRSLTLREARQLAEEHPH